MALIDCIGCGKKISNLAEKCPKCQMAVDQSINTEEQVTKTFNSTIEEKQFKIEGSTTIQKIENEIENEKTNIEPEVESIKKHPQVNPKNSFKKISSVQQTSKDDNVKTRLIILSMLIGIVLVVLFIIKMKENSSYDSIAKTSISLPVESLNKKDQSENNIHPPVLKEDTKNQSRPSSTVRNVNKSETISSNSDLERVKKEMYKNDISNYVTIQNQYKAKLIAGVKDIVIAVTNKTEYNLERVTINVYYYKMNDELYTVKQLDFYNVPAGKRLLKRGEETNVGMYIQTDIKEIYAPELD